MTLTGIPIPPLKPGSPEWLKTISASKIPAILGISPWQSRFALWHLMAGNTEPWAGNKTTERGTFLEAAVIQWFESQRPELQVLDGDSFAHHEREEWTAAPDATGHVLVRNPVDGFTEAGDKFGVEVKTSQFSDGWGAAGTAEIPPYYLAQVAWQMIVCGFDTVYVPVLFGQPFEFREYVVTRADVEADIPVIIAAVEDFQASLAAGEQPDIDGSSATYTTLRELHPDIDGEEVEVSESIALDFLDTKLWLDSANDAHGEAKNKLTQAMGTAKKATVHGETLATRQARSGGTPYLVAARTLPTISKEVAA